MKKFMSILRFIGRHWRLFMITLVALLLSWGVWKLVQIFKSDAPLVSIEHNEAIEQTPEEIRSIRDIGQWEFLSVETEELIEKHEPHTFGDAHLVKIFRGTLRIGIDMQQADENWFVPDGETAHLTLPAIGLLDEDFIDEAHTVTFYEKGSFSAKEKQELYNSAVKKMKARCLTEHNLQEAQKAAEAQFTSLFQSFGYKTVEIKFTESQPAEPQR